MGEDELAAGKVKVKDLVSGAELSIDSGSLLEQLLAIEEAGGIPTES